RLAVARGGGGLLVVDHCPQGAGGVGDQLVLGVGAGHLADDRRCAGLEGDRDGEGGAAGVAVLVGGRAGHGGHAHGVDGAGGVVAGDGHVPVDQVGGAGRGEGDGGAAGVGGLDGDVGDRRQHRR